jgi:hypothetical protein
MRVILSTIVLAACSAALTAAAEPVTIDFNGWQPMGYADGGVITGTNLEGPNGEKAIFFTGTWDARGATNRPNGIVTVPTVPNGTYNVDFIERADKDVVFTTDENGHIATLKGNGIKTGTVERIGPSALQINTVEIVWKTDADPRKMIALDNSARIHAPAGTCMVPVGTWEVHWWGMHEWGKAPVKNTTCEISVRAGGITPAEFVVHGGTPDPAILYMATGEAAIPLRGAVVSSQIVVFENVTEAMGLGGMGKGHGAWVDYNNDGWTDLQDGQNIWRNEEGMKFVKSGSGSGLSAWGDIDNDGWLDYFGAGGGAVMFGSSEGEFTGAEEKPERICRVSDGGTIADVDGDGLLDIYWTGYELNWQYQPDAIWLNQGDRTFKRTWKTEGRAQPGRGTTACDFDNDGDMDIYVSNYRLEANILLVNGGNGNFTNQAAAYNARGGNGHSLGAAFGDVDNDGYIDIFAGNFAHGGQPQSQFLRNLGPGKGFHFENKGTCGVHYQESYGSPALGDYDNDGDLDLFFTTVYGGDQAVLYRNEGVTTLGDGRQDWMFRNVTAEAGLGGIRSTAQAAWGDFDNDGDLDLVSGGRLWRNRGTKGNWLKVKLQGAGNVNRAAIGAQVRIKLADRTLTRQVESSTGCSNVNDLTLHFGLGVHDGGEGSAPADRVELEITWPYTRAKQTVTAEANSLVTVTTGERE